MRLLAVPDEVDELPLYLEEHCPVLLVLVQGLDDELQEVDARAVGVLHRRL